MWTEKLKNGKYAVRENYKDPLTGKNRKVSVTIEKNTRSERKAAEELIRRKIDEVTLLPSDSDPTIGDISEAYLIHQQQTTRPQTFRRDRVMIGKITDMLGADTKARKLSARLITQRLEATKEDNTTRNTYLAHIKRMLKWAYSADYIEDVSYLNKLRLYPDNKRERIEDKYLSTEELMRLLDGMKSERWHLLTEFLALSGLRIGEARALNDADVGAQIAVNKTMDANTDEITTSAKTDAGNRSVDVQPELADVVKKIRHFVRTDKLRNGYRSDLFFPKIEYSAYNKYLKENSAAIIEHKITPHALRHTHVSLLAEQGVPLDVISRRVGHEDSDITRKIYLHITEKQREKDRAIMEKVRILG